MRREDYAGATVIFGAEGGFAEAETLFFRAPPDGWLIGGALAADGDVNGDGVDDLAIAGPESGRAGEIFVIFGDPAFSGPNVAPVATDNTIRTGPGLVDLTADWGGGFDRDANGDPLTLVAIGETPVSPGDVVALGDVTLTIGEGAAVAVDAPGLSLGDARTVDFTYAIADPDGATASAAATLTFTADTVDIATLEAEGRFSPIAPELRTVGDVNGDGRADFFQWNYDHDQITIVYGDATGIPRDLDLSDIGPEDGFVFTGNKINFGPIGDVNGDGFDDLAFSQADSVLLDTVYGGVREYDYALGEAGGATYVLFGQAGPRGALNEDGLEAAAGLIVNRGANRYSYHMETIAAAGDVNGDGVGDILLGAPFLPSEDGLDDRMGGAYVIFGADGGSQRRIDVEAFDGTDGFWIVGAESGDYSGVRVASVGDVNADGRDDVLVHSIYGGPTDPDGSEDYRSASFVIFGPEAPTPEIRLGALDPDEGFSISVDPDLGRITGLADGVGDVDGDGSGGHRGGRLPPG